MGVRPGEMPVTWDDDERSPHLLTLLRNNKALSQAISDIEPEILNLGERKLESKIREGGEKGKKFPVTLGRLKIQFWEEYRLAVQEKRWMRGEDIFHGVCARNYWQLNVIENPINLAWLIHPPVDELVLQKEIIQLGFAKQREILDFPIYEYKTRVRWVDGERIEESYRSVNLPLLKEINAMVKNAQDRVYGSVIKREQSEKKTLNVHVKGKAGAPIAPGPTKSLSSPDLSLEDLEAIEQKLHSLQKTLQGVAKTEGVDLNDDTVEGEILDNE